MPPSRRRLGCLSALVISAAALLVIYAGLSPWALHIGGRSTLDGQWDGFGQVQASNGGRYVLFTHLLGGAMYGSHPGRHSSGYALFSSNQANSETCDWPTYI